MILCSICKRNDKIVTDPESGEIICSNCGMVIIDKAEDTSHPERSIFSSREAGQIDYTSKDRISNFIAQLANMYVCCHYPRQNESRGCKILCYNRKVR